ncbi:DUF2304 family protein [Candidatus Peregrinibacteria bacterium]|nr:DUF2304 family protein [Candidatus Peregrinibacteria bacterium]
MAIQILVSIFVIFAISRIVLQYKYDNVTIKQFIFWIIIWGSILGIVFWPRLIEKIADSLGIGRGIDVFVYFGIILLFYLVYRSYIKMENLERDITKIVGGIALKDLDKKE